LPVDFCVSKEKQCLQFLSIVKQLIQTEQDLEQALIAQKHIIMRNVDS
jgi:hypothetical protein